jgi:hypothetical protein
MGGRGGDSGAQIRSVMSLSIAERLQKLRRICTVLALSVWAYGIAVLLLVDYEGGRPAAPVPGMVPLSLTGLAAILILLSSRVRSTLLRRGLPRHPDLPIDAEAVLAVYPRATIASFALLEAAALLGLLVALLSGKTSYGLILCGAALLSMFSRWPREVEVDRLIRGKASP